MHHHQGGSSGNVPLARFEHFVAHPGPVLPENFGTFPGVDGSKAQRMARMKALNGANAGAGAGEEK